MAKRTYLHEIPLGIEVSRHGFPIGPAGLEEDHPDDGTIDRRAHCPDCDWVGPWHPEASFERGEVDAELNEHRAAEHRVKR